MVTTRALPTGELTRRREALGRWVAVLLPGVVLYLAPLPALTAGQRHLTAIFAATIIALMAQPLPMGASVLLSMTLLALTGTVPVTRVLSGFGNSTAWMILSALLFGRAVAASGFGARLAYLFIRRFGRSPLSLAYSIAVTDTVLAPFVPSDTSRGGAILDYYLFPTNDLAKQHFRLAEENGLTLDLTGLTWCYSFPHSSSALATPW